MKKSLIVLLAVTFCACLFAGHAGAEVVLFQEDWSSGGINPAVWAAEGGGAGAGGPFVYDLGLTGQSTMGDYGLFVQDTAFAYTKSVRSLASYSRALQLACTFSLFHDNVPPSWSGAGGPWTGRSGPVGGLPVLEQIEAGMSRRNASNGQSYYMEGMQTGYNGDGEPLSAAFNAAYDAAIDKTTALTVRVTLGTSTGAKMEWSVGGGGFTTEFDTIGQPAGTPIGPGGVAVVGSAEPVWLVFGGAGDGGANARAIVDDIVVTGIPEPATLTLLGLGGLLAYRRRR